MTDDAYRQLMKHAHRLAMDGHGELAQFLRDAMADAQRYRWLRGDSCLDHSIRWAQWEVRRWDAPQWTGDLRRADLDAAIDAARGKE